MGAQSDDFVLKLLVSLLPVALAGITSFVERRFGWRANLLRDSEAYRALADVIGDTSTEDEQRILTVMRQRAIKSAKRSMEQNKNASKALHAVLVFNFVVMVLSFVDLYQYLSGTQVKELHDIVSMLLVVLVVAFAVTLIWFCADAHRTIDARRLEIEYLDAKRSQRGKFGEEDWQTMATAFEVLSKRKERLSLEEIEKRGG